MFQNDGFTAKALPSSVSLRISSLTSVWNNKLSPKKEQLYEMLATFFPSDFWVKVTFQSLIGIP